MNGVSIVLQLPLKELVITVSANFLFKGELVIKKNKFVMSLIAGVASLGMLAACGSVGETPADTNTGGTETTDSGSGEDNFRIALVPKVEGISWFQRMAEGVVEFDADHENVQAWQIGPDTEDAAKQVAVIEDLIAQNVDAIVVVPNDPHAVAPVLEKARERGIVVVTHEAPALANTESIDLDVEAFSNEAFGEQMFGPLGEAMGGEGLLVASVGSLTSETHMAWYNAGIAYLEANYPNIEIATANPYEDNNSDETARNNAQEILRAYPDMKGFAGTSVSSLANFAAVLKEKGNTSVAATGLSLPSIAGPYLDEGWMYHAQTWDPAGAGYASVAAALALLKGEEVTTGTDLGYEGYNSVTVEGKIVVGDATLILTPNQYPDGYPF